MKKLLLIGLLFSIVFLYGCSANKGNDDIVLDIAKLAQCLGEKGVKMYGTESCGHCIDQKELFGDSFKYITYVDCAKTPDVCSKIEGTPTREFVNGDLLLGKQMISTLAKKAGCSTK